MSLFSQTLQLQPPRQPVEDSRLDPAVQRMKVEAIPHPPERGGDGAGGGESGDLGEEPSACGSVSGAIDLREGFQPSGLEEARFRGGSSTPASVSWDVECYSFPTFRPPDWSWTMGGKTAAERVKEMRMKLATGGFQRMVRPTVTWSDAVSKLPKSVTEGILSVGLPVAIWLKGSPLPSPLRVRLCTSFPPNHNLLLEPDPQIKLGGGL